jgi:hypothetical protein
MRIHYDQHGVYPLYPEAAAEGQWLKLATTIRKASPTCYALYVSRGSQRENPSVYCKAAGRCKSRAILKREKSQQAGEWMSPANFRNNSNWPKCPSLRGCARTHFAEDARFR